MSTIHVTPEELLIITKILKGYPPCYVFGSRAKGTQKRFSDLDLCFKGNTPIPDAVIAELEEKFSESNLPFKVDIIDYHTISPSFRRVIEPQFIPLKH